MEIRPVQRQDRWSQFRDAREHLQLALAEVDRGKERPRTQHRLDRPADVEVVPAGATRLTAPGDLDLREREIESVYVEANRANQAKGPGGRRVSCGVREEFVRESPGTSPWREGDVTVVTLP